MEEYMIWEVYGVTDIGNNTVAVDFLQVSEHGKYRMLKYFDKDEWDEDISKTFTYKACRAFDSDKTVAREMKLCR